MNEIRFERIEEGWQVHICAHEPMVDNPESPDGIISISEDATSAWQLIWQNVFDSWYSPNFIDNFPMRESIKMMELDARIPVGMVYRIAYNQKSNYYLGQRLIRVENDTPQENGFAVHSDDGAICLANLVLLRQR